MEKKKGRVTGRVTASTTPVLRIQEMLVIMNMSRSTLYRKMAEDPNFPQAKKQSGSKRWRRDEVVAYLSEAWGYDASHTVSECLEKLREQLREQGRWGSKQTA